MADPDLAAVKTSGLSGPAKAVKYDQTLMGTKNAPSGLGRFEAQQVREWAGHDVPSETDLHDAGALKSQPGASVDRGRQLAQSVREGRSSFAKPATSTEPKAAAPIKSGKAADITTDTGEQAGAIKSLGRAPKDLGRVTTKLLKTTGEEGGISSKIAGSLKNAFSGRVASSLGNTLGAVGGVMQAVQGARAMQGLQSGKAVNPVTLEPEEYQDNGTYVTPQGTYSGKTIKAMRGSREAM
jgi:hypothetical protein